MITTLKELRKQFRGMSCNTVLEISDAGITVFVGTYTPVRKVNKREVFSLIDQGFTYQNIADRFGVSIQAIHSMDNRKTNIIKPLAHEDRGDE